MPPTIDRPLKHLCPYNPGPTGNPFDNAEFREEFKRTLDEKLSPLVKTVEEHTAKIDEHDRVLQRRKGAIVVLGTLSAGVGTLLFEGGAHLLHRILR